MTGQKFDGCVGSVCLIWLLVYVCERAPWLWFIMGFRTPVRWSRHTRQLGETALERERGKDKGSATVLLEDKGKRSRLKKYKNGDVDVMYGTSAVRSWHLKIPIACLVSHDRAASHSFLLCMPLHPNLCCLILASSCIHESKAITPHQDRSRASVQQIPDNKKSREQRFFL